MKKTGWLLTLFFSVHCAAAGDIAAGKAKTEACVACHTESGNSSNPIWPNLAGQHAGYLYKQLQDYQKADGRDNEVMRGIVANLSAQDMADLAAYYASLPVAEAATPEQYVERGEQLYRGGDRKAGISACIACHGPRGKGNSQAHFPLVSGQHAAYTIEQLQLFKEGKRHNDLNAMMRDISQRMSPEDMEAVAYYMQGLH
ncbi:MAG: cytochrome c4 [Legionellaceae bacterium]|nr:cytochrome c4 [Legionellaceae bacterium]